MKNIIIKSEYIARRIIIYSNIKNIYMQKILYRDNIPMQKFKNKM